MFCKISNPQVSVWLPYRGGGGDTKHVVTNGSSTVSRLWSCPQDGTSSESSTNVHQVAPLKRSVKTWQSSCFDMAKDVPGYLAEQQRKCSGDLAQEWATLEEYYTKRYVFKIKPSLTIPQSKNGMTQVSHQILRISPTWIVMIFYLPNVKIVLVVLILNNRSINFTVYYYSGYGINWRWNCRHL